MGFEFSSYIIAQGSINCIAGMLPDTVTVHSTTSENVE